MKYGLYFVLVSSSMMFISSHAMTDTELLNKFKEAKKYRKVIISFDPITEKPFNEFTSAICQKYPQEIPANMHFAILISLIRNNRGCDKFVKAAFLVKQRGVESNCVDSQNASLLNILAIRAAKYGEMTDLSIFLNLGADPLKMDDDSCPYVMVASVLPKRREFPYAVPTLKMLHEYSGLPVELRL